jgi:acyl-coenzyme A synthetase/AMP-(fatty) acid ligase/acetyl-CoA acetyltransferase
MTVYRAFTDAVAQHADRPFLRAPGVATAAYADDAVEYSYASAKVAVDVLAGAYAAVGVELGHRVAVAYDSRLDVYIHLLALNALGAGLVPLNMAGSDEEILYVLEHSDAQLVTGADEHRKRLARLASRLDGVKSVTADELDGGEPITTAAGELSTEAALLYTSGTTGKPKGCMLANEYFLVMGHEYNGLGGYCAIDSNDRLLTPLPPGHMNALSTSFMAMLLCGGCVVQLDRFHPTSWWQTVREERATVIHYLGVMPAILLTMPAGDDNFGGQVKFGFGAGSDPAHQQVFEERFGFPLIEAWAMTESGGGGMIVANEEPRHIGQRCIGRPAGRTEYRLVDEADNDVPVGSDGELLVRARGDDPRRGFFSGYYMNEAATEEGWRGGWWHTGDVAREGPDGSLFFVDRRKNVIRRSGENIAAVEVEAALLRHPAVANCAVTAVPDEIRGDEVFACVVTDRTYTNPAELARRIFESAYNALTYFKAPGYIAFVDELPLTASQKVNRAAVKQLANECLQAAGALDLRALKRRRGIAKKTPRQRLGYDGVAVAVPVSVPYERYSHQPAHWWIGRTLGLLGEASGLSPQDIDGLCAASFTLFPDTVVGLSQHFGMTPRWLDHVPTGGASGVVTLRRAARAVQSGDADIVACVAGDTNHVDSFRAMLTSFSRFSQDASYPYGSGGPNGSFALMTRDYMNHYGIEREDFGKLCVAQRANALKYPQALMKSTLSLEQYMAARKIADPIHLFDCVMPCAGGEGYLVMREDIAAERGLAYARVLSTIERHNAFPDDPVQIRGGWALDKDELWAMAGITPDKVDLLQTYDDYPVVIAMQFEDLGFCQKGESAEFIREHTFTTDGSFPHNTSGGQLSVGQAGAAGGFLGMVEAIRQITGGAEQNAVAEAKIAAVSGFGMINFDRGLCSGAAILEAA